MGYSEVSDLLLGDLIVGPNIDKQKFIDLATDEIDSKLGWLYQLPLEANSPATNLPGYQLALLKMISNQLASGQLILTLDIAGEGTQLHAYGWYLIRTARSQLNTIANGDVLLDAIRNASTLQTGPDRLPAIINHDGESLILAFENTVLRGEPWYSRPGELK